VSDAGLRDDVKEQAQFALDDRTHKDGCDECGKAFKPRTGTGGSPQRFCSTNCRLSFHAESQRSQRGPACDAPTRLPATEEQPALQHETSEDEDGFVLMGQQDYVEVAWDQHGNLLLRQNRLFEGDQELRISRDYFPQFVTALDVLRELVADAIRKDGAL
jgi:hypothetical protein